MYVFISKSFLLLFAAISCLSITSCQNKNGGDETLIVVPSISISDFTWDEGNNATTPFEFTITLDKATTKEVSVIVNTKEATAKATSDFTSISNQTISIQPGETSKKVVVNINGDTVKEDDEQFQVVLSNAVNGKLDKHTGNGTIKNDDAGGAFTNLVWSEEFNGTSLDMNSWSFETGDGCPALCGWGNNELEYYTARPENLFLQNGSLVIEAKKESYNNKNYTSAKIVTRDKKNFKFGRIDIRAQLPEGKGIWPAFWMLPQNNVYGVWPKSGELDLMEMVGHQPNKVYGTIHYGPGPGSIQQSNGYTLPTGKFSDGFHIFSTIWDLNEIKWLVDDQVYATVSKSSFGAENYPFNEQFYLIINLAIGGNWPGSPDASTVFPQRLEVDYIHVYQ